MEDDEDCVEFPTTIFDEVLTQVVPEEKSEVSCDNPDSDTFV